MKQPFLLNSNGKPYKPARFVNGKKGKQPYIEYWMYHIQKGKAVRRRFYQIKGNTPAAKREHAKYLVQQINKMLVDGYVFGKEIPEIESKGIVIPNLLDSFQKIVDLKQAENGDRSGQAYRSFFNTFKSWYLAQKIDPLINSFQKEHILLYLDWLVTERTYRGKKGVGNVTRNNHLTNIHAVFEALKERGIIKENPAKGIRRLKEEKNNNVAFSDRQMETLTAYLKANDPNLYVYTRFIYYCFLRPVELLRMRVRDIDLKNRVILIRAKDSKNHNQASVVIPRALMKYIEELNLSNYPPHYHVFSKADLRPGPIFLIRNRVSERHAKAIKACKLNIGGLNMYSWKHTGNKNAYLAGVDIKTIQAQNRHHSLAVTDVYLRSLGVRIEKDLLDKDW